MKNKMSLKENNLGFTLIELIVTMLIIGILIMVAFPSYRHYIHKSHRIEAFQALSIVQEEEERFRASCAQYATALADSAKTSDTCAAPKYEVLVKGLKTVNDNGAIKGLTESGYYAIYIDAINTDISKYRIVADATDPVVTNSSQVSDKTGEKDCSKISLLVDYSNNQGIQYQNNNNNSTPTSAIEEVCS